MNRGTCIHYTGLRFEKDCCCAAGVNYREAFDGKQPGILLRLPCIRFFERPAHGRGTYIRAGEASVDVPFDRQGQKEIPCALYVEPTPEQIQTDRAEADASYEKSLTAIKIASEWRVRPKPQVDRVAEVECPICHGRLHLSQSAYNGHVRGRCETDGCVSWVE